jgi:hypothetical protein
MGGGYIVEEKYSRKGLADRWGLGINMNGDISSQIDRGYTQVGDRRI